MTWKKLLDEMMLVWEWWNVCSSLQEFGNEKFKCDNVSCPICDKKCDKIIYCRNWHWDEPSCGGDMCVVLYHQPSAPPDEEGHFLFQWNDDNCNSKNNFVCKYPEGEPEDHRHSTVELFGTLGFIWLSSPQNLNWTITKIWLLLLTASTKQVM